MPAGSRSTRAQLLALLRGGHALTQREMTERLPIDSKRHARRLVQQLREHGVPLKERQRGREKEYWLPPGEWRTEEVELELTEHEALALMLALEAARSGLGPAPLGEALDEAVAQLIDELPGSVDTFEPTALLDHLHFGEAASVDVNPSVVMGLVDALSNRRAVAIDYHAASSDTYYEGRRIHPWALAVRGDAWLCVARDPRKDELRDFNVSRVDDVRRADPSSHGGDYVIPDDFDLELYFIDRFESLDAEKIYEVRLLLEPDVVPYFHSKSYHRTQQLHEDEGEGDRVVVSYEVAGLEEIAAFVPSWGPDGTVLDPPALAERIAADARTVVARYDESDPSRPDLDTGRPES